MVMRPAGAVWGMDRVELAAEEDARADDAEGDGV